MPIETVDLVSSQAVTEREEVDSLPEVFWENTKLRPRAGVQAAVKRIQWFFADPRKFQSSRQSFKTYATVPRIALPDPLRERPPLPAFDAVMHARRSALLSGTGPVFSPDPVPLGHLGDLLYYTYGVARARPQAEAPPVEVPVAPAAAGEVPVDAARSGGTRESPDLVGDQKERAFTESAQPVELLRRLAPSGGALYPLEVYAVVVNGEGVPPGVYHYNAFQHALEQLRTGDAGEVREELARLVTAGLNYEGVAAALVLTAVPLRVLFKYGDRGFRLLLVEAGHAAQNTCLAAAALGLSLCAVAGFYDDDVNRALGVNGLDEFAAHLLLLGMPLDGEGAAP